MAKNPFKPEKVVVVIHPCPTCGYQNGLLKRTKKIPCPRCGRVMPRVKGWTNNVLKEYRDKMTEAA